MQDCDFRPASGRAPLLDLRMRAAALERPKYQETEGGLQPTAHRGLSPADNLTGLEAHPSAAETSAERPTLTDALTAAWGDTEAGTQLSFPRLLTHRNRDITNVCCPQLQ